MYCLRPSRGIMNMKILNSEMLLAARVSKYGLHACIKRGAGVETKHLLSTLKWSEVKLLSRVRLFVTLWTVAYQAPPYLGFSRQKY